MIGTQPLVFIAHGQPALGLTTAIGAKIAGTAPVARIYTLTEPNLLRIGWFAWAHERFVAFKTRIYTALKSTSVYQAARRLRLQMRAALTEWSRRRRTVWRNRWEAALKLSRRGRQSKQ